ncbi:MAG: pseudouridine synthase [Thalassotalea sp.]|nr:pseudouridine synthase [Thalassotalea sp.]
MLSEKAPTCFTLLPESKTTFKLPERFTYPFVYQPNELAIAASQLLQEKLPLYHSLDADIKGRMYGVLVVQNAAGEIGYLSAMSGNNNDLYEHQESLPDFQNPKENQRVNFVPNIFTGFEEGSEYQRKHSIVNQLNAEINALTNDLSYQQLQQLVVSEGQAAEFQISKQQRQATNNRKARKAERHSFAANNLSEEAITARSIELSRQSVADKKRLTELKKYWQQRVSEAKQTLAEKENAINDRVKTRSKLSSQLQKMMFSEYQLLNADGDVAPLLSLFTDTVTRKPPSGSGDCAAPKLLQYAYKHQLKPICLAEFWWGQQPSSEIRKHAHYYPACQGKCLPILTHMLKGLAVDDNPLLVNPATDKTLDIIFQDDDVVVVNKPAGMLSVPGKTIDDSAYTRVKHMFRHTSGSLVLHRLDMATSGLLVFALNKRAHKHLQKQFINKVVQKRYVAIVEGNIEGIEGEIHLPLILDINDRPRQMVCYEHGKRAETHWQVIERCNGHTRLYLHPITGRTHQLRVHCSHPDGLNTPITGDGFYGKKGERLHLHAEQLSFLHPISQERLTFRAAPDF